MLLVHLLAEFATWLDALFGPYVPKQVGADIVAAAFVVKTLYLAQRTPRILAPIARGAVAALALALAWHIAQPSLFHRESAPAGGHPSASAPRAPRGGRSAAGDALATPYACPPPLRGQIAVDPGGGNCIVLPGPL